MKDSEQLRIGRCKTLIEERLDWKESRYWTHRDYEYLRETVFKKTGTLLSVSTFKRLWKDQHGLPHPSTLDALAAFLDYEDWLEFKCKIDGASPSSEVNAGMSRFRPILMRLRGLRNHYATGLGIVGLILVIILFLTQYVDVILSATGFHVFVRIQSFILNVNLFVSP